MSERVWQSAARRPRPLLVHRLLVPYRSRLVLSMVTWRYRHRCKAGSVMSVENIKETLPLRNMCVVSRTVVYVIVIFRVSSMNTPYEYVRTFTSDEHIRLSKRCSPKPIQYNKISNTVNFMNKLNKIYRFLH